jgi:hypothetical protein
MAAEKLSAANDMPDRDRLAVLVLIAVFIAFILLKFWRESASQPWSSDPWLINTALAISMCGPVALLLLIVVLWLRKK